MGSGSGAITFLGGGGEGSLGLGVSCFGLCGRSGRSFSSASKLGGS